MMKPTPSITIPFFAFVPGAGIDPMHLVRGGMVGVILGVLVSLVTGAFGSLAFRENAGMGFAIGTTADNESNCYAVIADDLTGAGYTGVQSARAGLWGAVMR